MDGAGAAMIPSMEYMQIEKWARAKPGSGNMLTDRGRLLDGVTTLVARNGSAVNTRGGYKQLSQMAKSMRSDGFELKEWQFPTEVLNPPDETPGVARKRDGDDAAADPTGENGNGNVGPGHPDA